MTTNTSIPNTFRLSPLSAPSRYISYNSISSTAELTSNISLALILYSQTLTPVPAVDFKICTVDNNTDIYQPQNSCLDQWGNNVTQATLQTAAGVTGQAWNRTWVDKDGSGGWTLRSEFAGPARRLAVDADGLNLVMEEGDNGVANALWAFEDAGDAVSTVTGSATASSRTSSTAPSTASGTATVTSAGETGGAFTNEGVAAAGLSSGALAGIIVGILALVLVFAIISYVWWRRRRSQRSPVGASVPSEKVDSSIGWQELPGDGHGGYQKKQELPAELQEMRRAELEGHAPRENKPAVYELPS